MATQIPAGDGFGRPVAPIRGCLFIDKHKAIMFSFEEHKDDLILVGGCRPQKRIISPTDDREMNGR